MNCDDLPMPERLRLARRIFEASGKRFFSFISYTTREAQSSHIRTIVGNVCAELNSCGIPTHESPVFHDGIFDIGGTDLSSNIESALSSSVIVSAYISPLYFDSPYCRVESEHGLRTKTLHWLMWKPIPHFASTQMCDIRGRDISKCTIFEASELALGDTLCCGIGVLQAQGY
jgi:hypothetical protein